MARFQREVCKISDPEILAAWLERHGERYYLFCPGCETIHCASVRVHGWNGSLDLPTLTPSLLVTWRDFSDPNDYNSPPVDKRCHSFVKDGKIQFLGDCTHALANQTVDLPEHTTWPDWARQDLK